MQSQRMNLSCSRVGLLCLLIVLFGGFSLTLRPALAHKFAVSGVVHDSFRKPVKGVQVYLWEPSNRTIIESGRSNKEGFFKLVHEECNELNLEASPDETSGLAGAIVEKISGMQDRKVIIELHRGFLVRGRVMHGDKGLKGVKVKALASDKHKGSTVHGGGFAKTGRGGYFSMVLTPGRKKIVVSNDHIEGIQKKSEREVVITEDITLEDFSLGTQQ